MELDDDARQEIADLLFAGQKIAAIKVYREVTGVGLKEAKDFIDELSDRLRAEEPGRIPPASSGCGVAVLLVVAGAGLATWWLV